MSSMPIYTHRYIGVRSSCCAEICVLLMVMHDSTTDVRFDPDVCVGLKREIQVKASRGSTAPCTCWWTTGRFCIKINNLILSKGVQIQFNDKFSA